MSTDDAKLFSKLCGFNCRIGGEIQPLVYNEKAEIYTGNGVNFSALNHLETIGLINFNSLSEYVWNLSAQTVLVAYSDTSCIINFEKKEGSGLKVGKVVLTYTGRELASICMPERVTGFDEYLSQWWEEKGVKVEP